MHPQATPVPQSHRPALLLAGGLLVAGLIGATAVWLLFFAGDPPQRASIDDAAGVLGSAAPSSAPAEADDAGATGAAGASADLGATPAVGDGVDGIWTIYTTVGSFADYTSAWAGFRVDEVLAQGIGETTAIGRTPSVSGELQLDGQALTAATIEVDLTTIRSDRPRRDDAIQDALATGTFAAATFELSEPVDLGAVPSDGQTVSVTAVGELTIHGISRLVEFPLEARLVGDTIAVVGSTTIVFSDFGITMPSAPIVLSVEDVGVLEVQLFFRRS